MKTETVNMHQLNEGDRVLFYGIVFELRNRVNHGMRFGGDAEIQGDLITFETTVIDASNRSQTFPEAWLKDWVFQGNKLRSERRIIAE